MELIDILQQSPDAIPDGAADNIPWSDPDFSERMLKEHLSQDHDLASRRIVIIDEHVDTIHRTCLSGKPSKILDLGCGPGLYSHRLAKLGHDCTGIDYSPASIEHARQQAAEADLPITYIHDDLRRTDFGTGYDLVMMIFGELNVFCPDDIATILTKANNALDNNGILLVEPNTFDVVKKIGETGQTWYSSKSGLFSDKPHLCLQSGYWDADKQRTLNHFFIVDAATAEVQCYTQRIQAYHDDDFTELFELCGFSDVTVSPSLGGTDDTFHENLIVVSGRKHEK
ncbi:class I SAM-dependent methyltransferase [Candidatus Latescibacterota bacterium]